jgi:hypothetical protein
MPSRRATAPNVQASLPIPQGWFDKTMTVYAAPLAPGDVMAANIVVSRDALAADEDFPSYCQRQADTFGGSLPGCSILSRVQGQFGTRIAERIELEWSATTGRLHQLVVFIAAGEGVVVSFAASAAAKSFESYRPQFEDSLSLLSITPSSG